MPISDKTSPAQIRRPRADRPPARQLREAGRLDRTRRMEAVMAALARVRAVHGNQRPSR